MWSFRCGMERTAKLFAERVELKRVEQGAPRVPVDVTRVCGHVRCRVMRHGMLHLRLNLEARDLAQGVSV